MINEYAVKKYCNESLSLIENFDKAIADSNQMWHCHHRRELETSRKELIKIGEYYNRPASELIFLTPFEHNSLHMKGKQSHWLGKHHTEEAKRKIAEARKGMKFSEETKKKLSIALKGKPTWNKGIPHTEESKLKMSIAKKGNKNMLGKHHTEESKRKMSVAKKNMSEETKRKLSEANFGKHWFNNGIKAVFVKECPEGFVKGRLKKAI